jgi:DNA repair exonuclease SbcCD nuclease subunit
MPVVFTSDLQLRNHQNRSRILPSGRNSRLQNGLDCIVQAAALAKGGTIVLNGDIYDDRHHLGVDVVDATCETILGVAKENFVLINVGNHDQFLKDGSIHSLRMFHGRKHIKVVPNEGAIYMDYQGTCQLAVHPYTEDQEKLRQFVKLAADTAEGCPLPTFLVLHQGVQGAVLSNGEVDSTGLGLKYLKADKFAAVVLGHYHKPQAVGGQNIFYVGSPYQVNAGEAGEEKRFLVWDGELRSVPVKGMPKFVSVRSLEEATTYPDDFVTLVCDPADFDPKNCPPNVVFLPERKIVKESGIRSANLQNFDIAQAVMEDLKKRGYGHLVDEALRRLGA